MFKEKYQHMNKEISPSPELIHKVICSTKIKTENEKRNLRITYKPAITVAILLICLVTTVPVLASTVPSIYQLMYDVSPSIAQFFIPVQKSCEDNGIKMEVVASYIHDDTAEIYITMQDLTDNRIDESTDLYDSYSIQRPFNSVATCKRVGYDETTKTATFLISITEYGNKKIAGDKITFSVKEFLSNKKEYNDIPVECDLEAADSNSLTKITGVNGGGGINYDKYFSKDTDSVKVLSPSDQRKAIVEGIDLAGIGYIDGMLHVQIAVKNPLSNDNHGFIFLKDSTGNEIQCDYNIFFKEVSDSGEEVGVNEYIFNISKDEIKHYKLYGDFVTSDLLTEGNWKVTFPLEVNQNK